VSITVFALLRRKHDERSGAGLPENWREPIWD
jgi:hypothetical protein